MRAVVVVAAVLALAVALASALPTPMVPKKAAAAAAAAAALSGAESGGVRNERDDPHPLDAVNAGAIRVPRQPHTHQRASGVSLVASPSTIVNGDWVTVAWSGVSSPSAGDWIGVYSPANADVSKTKPVKYLMLAKVSGYTATGSGSWRFRLLNLRADTAFVLYRGGLNSPVWTAISNSVGLSAPNEPLGVHMAVGAEPNAVTISWTSAVAGGEVGFGTEQGAAPVWWVNASSTTYTKDDLCGKPATGEGWLPQGPGWFNNALLTGLDAGVTYYYVVGADGAYSSEYSFVGPANAADDAEWSFFAFGDLGQEQPDGTLNWSDGHDFQPSRNSTQQMTNIFGGGGSDDGDTFKLVLHIGDISYARGYAGEWPNFFDQIQPLSSALPWMVTDGNHERDFPGSGALFNGTDSGGECGVPYAHRFVMPAAAQRLALGDPEQELRRSSDGSGSVHDTPWYSQEYANVHFVLMSTEHDFSVGSEQWEFLKADLESVNRTATPWLIFAGHRPMYIDSTATAPPDGDQYVATQLRDSLEQLLVDNDVDLALWGHHHSYQRTCNVFQSKCVDTAAGERAPIHMVIGNAGAGLSTNIQPTKPAWFNLVRDDYYGYTTMRVRPDSLRIRSIESASGQIMDEFEISK